MSKDAVKNVPSDEMTSSELVALGKRNMACHDANNAVLCYARACSKIAKEHGPLSEELAEPSYLYGRALLETARLEASVLGGTLPEEEDPSSSSSDEEEPDQSDVRESEVGLNRDHDATTSSTNTEGNSLNESSSHDQEVSSSHNPVESSCADQASSSHDQGEGSHDQKEHLDNQKADSHDQAGSSNDQEGSSRDQEGSSHNQEDNQEVTGLQLAWEVLELSRVILSKQDTSKAKLQTADIMATLGEIGLESDMYDQAIKDFSASLEIKESLLPNHDRAIAELHFQLGLAYTLVKDFDSAIQAYQKAKNILQGRIEHLHSDIADETVTEKEGHQKELKDLEELLPDLDSKIEDVSDAKKQMLNSVMSCMQDEAGPSSSFAPSSSFGACSSAAVSKAPAKDISHLVRKRPVARDDTQPDVDAKRSKQAETSSVDNTTASEQ